MESQSLGLGARLGLALRIVLDGRLAARSLAALNAEVRTPPPALQPPAAASTAQAPAAAGPTAEDGAVHLLAILQREGRLVDFVQEDVSAFSDADVGAAARAVHQGCRAALQQVFALEPLRTDAEGARVTVERGFDPAAVRLTGALRGEPPFSGTLRHPGWRAASVQLPSRAASVDHRVVAPAEVEL